MWSASHNFRGQEVNETVSLCLLETSHDQYNPPRERRRNVPRSTHLTVWSASPTRTSVGLVIQQLRAVTACPVLYTRQNLEPHMKSTSNFINGWFLEDEVCFSVVFSYLFLAKSSW